MHMGQGMSVMWISEDNLWELSPSTYGFQESNMELGLVVGTLSLCCLSSPGFSFWYYIPLGNVMNWHKMQVITS